MAELLGSWGHRVETAPTAQPRRWPGSDRPWPTNCRRSPDRLGLPPWRRRRSKRRGDHRAPAGSPLGGPGAGDPGHRRDRPGATRAVAGGHPILHKPLAPQAARRGRGPPAPRLSSRRRGGMTAYGRFRGGPGAAARWVRAEQVRMLYALGGLGRVVVTLGDQIERCALLLVRAEDPRAYYAATVWIVAHERPGRQRGPGAWAALSSASRSPTDARLAALGPPLPGRAPWSARWAA